MGEVAAGGAPFVGEGRRQLLASLHSSFESVVRDRTPRWISLEAPTGWGKTRLAQELYRTLARDHQDDGAYWPASIVDLTAEDVADPVRAIGLERKQTYPAALDPALDSTPAWVWWGVSCSARFGAPTEALASDIAQLRILAPDLEKRWRKRASLFRRARKQVAGKRGELVDTSIGEAVGVAASLANVAVPGLGFLLAAVKWTAAGVADRISGQEERGDLREIHSKDLIDEVAAGLPQIAREIVPAVVFVEDVHLADEGLIEVLARIVSSDDCPVLVVTSSWPGMLERPDRPARVLLERVPDDRTERWTNEGQDASLSEIAVEERRTLVNALAPDLFSEAQGVLAERFRTPLALRLACGSARLRRAKSPERAVTVARSLPAEVARLYEEWWDELPPQVQRACMLASISSLAGVDPDDSERDDRWDSEILLKAARSVDWIADEVGGLSTLDQDGSAHQWVRSVDEWLRRFHEPDQFDIARKNAQSYWPDREELADFYHAFVGATEWDEISDERALIQARLVLALESAALADRNEVWEEALLRVMRHLAAQPDTTSLREAVTLYQKHAADLADLTLLQARSVAGASLQTLGRDIDALELLREALRDAARLHAEDDPAVLETRAQVADLTNYLGQPEEAVRLAEALYVDRTRVLGVDHPDTLNTRRRVAVYMAQAGQLDESAALMQAVLQAQVRAEGPQSRSALVTRRNLAQVAGESGRYEQCLQLLSEVVEELVRVQGPNSPDLLITREVLGAYSYVAGRYDEAVQLFQALLTDRLAAEGPDSRAAIDTRERLALAMYMAGHAEEGLHLLEDVTADKSRLLGPTHTSTLVDRISVAVLKARMGYTEEAVTEAERVWRDSEGSHGPDHRVTHMAREHLDSIRDEPSDPTRADT